MNNKKVFILSGPAGAWKNTLWDLVSKTCFNFVEESISMTTRLPRVWEVDGEHYHFISEEKFKELITEEAFLEYAHVHKYYYGSPKSELARITSQWKHPIYIIDVQGASIIKPVLAEEGYDVTTIFLLPPSIEEMKRRIQWRWTETEETFQIRLNSAIREYGEQDNYDIKIINDDIEKAKDELIAILNHD